MLFESEKSFGYPVLRTQAKEQDLADLDYAGVSFAPSLGLRINAEDKQEFIVRYENYMPVPALQELIVKGLAKYCLSIFCRHTFYSDFIDVEEGGEIHLEGKNLRDLVSLSMFVLANADGSLSSDQINEEFGFREFDFVAGQVLAQSAPIVYTVERDLYRSLKSIVELCSDEKLTGSDWYIDTENSDAVYVYAAQKTVKKVREFENTDQGRLLILNSFYTPVITQAIQVMEDQPEESKEKRWAQILEAKLAQIRSERTLRAEPHNQAQALFHQPLSKVNELLR